MIISHANQWTILVIRCKIDQTWLQSAANSKSPLCRRKIAIIVISIMAVNNTDTPWGSFSLKKLFL